MEVTTRRRILQHVDGAVKVIQCRCSLWFKYAITTCRKPKFLMLNFHYAKIVNINDREWEKGKMCKHVYVG